MAKDEDKCLFCGSKEIRIKTPFLKHGEPEYTFCCKSQAQNDEYQKAHFDPRTGEAPSKEEIEKQ